MGVDLLIRIVLFNSIAASVGHLMPRKVKLVLSSMRVHMICKHFAKNIFKQARVYFSSQLSHLTYLHPI